MSKDFLRNNSADQDKKASAERLQLGGLQVHVPHVLAVPLTLKFEEVGGGVTYIGEAVPGTALSEPKWRIKKILTTVAGVDILWADGNSDFDNVWDDRATLTYGT